MVLEGKKRMRQKNIGLGFVYFRINLLELYFLRLVHVLTLIKIHFTLKTRKD